MSKTINIHEAKTHLSRIVDDVAAGAEVIIAKAGKPMARLTFRGSRDIFPRNCRRRQGSRRLLRRLKFNQVQGLSLPGPQ